MRRLPHSKHFECGNCATRFLSIFGGIIKLPLTRLRDAQGVLPTDSTLSTQSPTQARGHWSGKVRKSLTPLKVSLVVLALGSFIIYQGFGGKALPEISRKYLQFFRPTPSLQNTPATSEPKNPPEGALVSNSTNLSKLEDKQAAPAVLPDEEKSPSENISAQGAPLPAPDPLASAARSVQIKIKRGESLSRIIAQHYPENKEIGLVAIILANPKINRDGIIYSGQVLKLPKLDSTDKTIQLQDNLFYALYGIYYYDADLKRETLWLNKNQVRFLVRSSKGSKGKNINRIILGGYETKDDFGKSSAEYKNQIKIRSHVLKGF